MRFKVGPKEGGLLPSVNHDNTLSSKGLLKI